jgi:hypothetical protein
MFSFLSRWSSEATRATHDANGGITRSGKQTPAENCS